MEPHLHGRCGHTSRAYMERIGMKYVGLVLPVDLVELLQLGLQAGHFTLQLSFHALRSKLGCCLLCLRQLHGPSQLCCLCIP